MPVSNKMVPPTFVIVKAYFLKPFENNKNLSIKIPEIIINWRNKMIDGPGEIQTILLDEISPGLPKKEFMCILQKEIENKISKL